MATILQLTLAMMSNLGQARAADYKVKPLTAQPRKEPLPRMEPLTAQSRKDHDSEGKGASAKKDKSLNSSKEKASNKKNRKNGGN